MRINKFIAANSGFSRRKADELISKGEVFLNGQVITSLGTDIDPEKDKIVINNAPITLSEEKFYLALNKPAGYLTTRKDEKNRKTVMELVPKNLNLKPVGRLDYDTEGLLLMSNDGEFINKHTHPRFECEKEYYAEIKGRLSDEQKKRLEKGVKIYGVKTAPAKVKILRTNEKETILYITIHEGRNRQIRKMFDALKCPVKYLKRVRIGQIKLDTLIKGKFRYLTKDEINAK